MSIQDDFFDIDNFFIEIIKQDKKNKWVRKAFHRIWKWGYENENENDKIRPIVDKMRAAINLMFEDKYE